MATVDGFQGREKEVILLSLVRSNNKGELGFLTEYNRLNVAVTRAKRALIIIGDTDTIETNSIFKTLVEECRAFGQVETVQDSRELARYEVLISMIISRI